MRVFFLNKLHKKLTNLGIFLIVVGVSFLYDSVFGICNLANLNEQKTFSDIRFITRYYPKANAICVNLSNYSNNVESMKTIESIENMLQSIVDVISQRPWFYFFNEETRFILPHYWEYILDQLVIIGNFLLKTPYNNMKHGQLSNSLLDNKHNGSLYDYFVIEKKSIIADFYALIFDYTIKLFNEGILTMDPKQISKYMSELEKIFVLLTGSIHEAKYYEALKTAGELISLVDVFDNGYDCINAK